MKVAEMLYQTFEVKTKRKSGQAFSLSTFKQNFKRTSNLQNSHDYVELNKAVDQFVKKLKELDLLK